MTVAPTSVPRIIAIRPDRSIGRIIASERRDDWPGGRHVGDRRTLWFPAMDEAIPTVGPGEVPTPAPKVIIVMPAYNAARTLERTYADIPHDIVGRIILVDDVSRDETVEIARQMGLDVIVHKQNLGYGGNQKTCHYAPLPPRAAALSIVPPPCPDNT